MTSTIGSLFSDFVPFSYSRTFAFVFPAVDDQNAEALLTIMFAFPTKYVILPAAIISDEQYPILFVWYSWHDRYSASSAGMKLAALETSSAFFVSLWIEISIFVYAMLSAL